MKETYSAPLLEIVKFFDSDKITTSITFDNLDDGLLYDDKW